MTFANAPWLLLLIPWLLLVIWMWRRRHAFVVVSTKLHWPERRGDSTARSDRNLPPLSTLITLLSMLACIIALANPAWPSERSRVTVIVDPHGSMTARVDGRPIYEELASRLAADIAALRIGVDLEIAVPGSNSPPSSLDDLRSISWTSAPTSALVAASAIHQRPGTPIIVLSAQDLRLPETALAYGPSKLPFDRGITHFSASIEPQPQAMVTIETPSSNAPVEVELTTSNGEVVHSKLEPITGQSLPERNLIANLPPSMNSWISVRLVGTDDYPLNDVARLVRRGHWPRLVTAGESPDWLERFVAVYARLRPADDQSPRVLLGGASDPSAPSIEFAQTRKLDQFRTACVDLPWKPIAGLDSVQIDAIAKSPPPDLTPIATAGQDVVLAVRSSPPCKVWVGFDTSAFSESPQCVAWMNGLIEFLADGDLPRWEVDGGRSATGITPPVRWRVDTEPKQEALRSLLASAKGAIPVGFGRVLCGVALGLGVLALMAKRGRLDGKGGAT